MDEQVGGRSGDGQEREAQPRGGKPHLLALQGWLVYAVLGVLGVLLVALLGSAEAGEIVALLPVGAGLGLLVGVPIRFVARERLGLPNPVPLDAGRARAIETRRKAAQLSAGADHGLRPGGRWAAAYLACARSVAAYHSVVEAVSHGAGRDWLAEIGVTLDRELSEARRLARLGENLEPDAPAEPNETTQRVLDRLRAAEKAFAETTDRAVTIALDLRDDSDFVRVRAQLDLLAEQAPRLLRTDV